jgi:hypothetical protein
MDLRHFRGARIAALTVLCLQLQSALGSMAASGKVSNVNSQTVPVGSFDYDVRVYDGSVVGSGGLYDIESFNNSQGKKVWELCFATADHNIDDGFKKGKIGFEMGRTHPETPDLTGSSGFILSSDNIYKETVKHRGPTGKEDLAFVGISILDSSLTADQRTYLQGFKPQLPFMVANGAASGATVTSYGYGLSARGIATLDGETGYVSVTSDAKNNYGVHRFVLEDIKGTKAAFKQSVYTYNEMDWVATDTVKYGQINYGDSGGVIRNKDGEWVGINTYSQSLMFDENLKITNKKDDAIGEIFPLNKSVGGGLMFTDNDLNWLGTQCDNFAAIAGTAPAPGAAIAFLFGLASRRRRRRRWAIGP